VFFIERVRLLGLLCEYLQLEMCYTVQIAVLSYIYMSAASVVYSELHYCNSLCYNLPKCPTSGLKHSTKPTWATN